VSPWGKTSPSPSSSSKLTYPAGALLNLPCGCLASLTLQVPRLTCPAGALLNLPCGCLASSTLRVPFCPLQLLVAADYSFTCLSVILVCSLSVVVVCGFSCCHLVILFLSVPTGRLQRTVVLSAFLRFISL
jgi:hypothetical protein